MLCLSFDVQREHVNCDLIDRMENTLTLGKLGYRLEESRACKRNGFIVTQVLSHSLL